MTEGKKNTYNYVSLSEVIYRHSSPVSLWTGLPKAETDTLLFFVYGRKSRLSAGRCVKLEKTLDIGTILVYSNIMTFEDNNSSAIKLLRNFGHFNK